MTLQIFSERVGIPRAWVSGFRAQGFLFRFEGVRSESVMIGENGPSL